MRGVGRIKASPTKKTSPSKKMSRVDDEGAGPSGAPAQNQPSIVDLLRDNHLRATMNDVFKTALIKELGEVTKFAADVSYEAFSAPKLRGVMEGMGGQGNFAADLIRLLALYHVR